VLIHASSSVSSCTDPTHVVNSDCSIDFPLASDDVWVDSVFTLETLAQRGIASAPKKIEFSCELDLTRSPSKAILVSLQYAVIL